VRKVEDKSYGRSGRCGAVAGLLRYQQGGCA
jgi:hypothetical protein